MAKTTMAMNCIDVISSKYLKNYTCFFCVDPVNEKGNQFNRIGLLASFPGRCECYNSG